MRLSALLPFFALLLPSHFLASPLTPRQVLSAPFSISWGSDSPSQPHPSVFRSSDSYTCGPYLLTAYGAYPPFTLDAISLPYDPRDVLSQHVVSSLGGGWGSGEVRWNVSVPIGTTFAIRMTDQRNQTVFSSEKTYEEFGGDHWGCEKTAAFIRWRLHRNRLIGTLAVCLPILIFFLLICWALCFNCACPSLSSCSCSCCGGEKDEPLEQRPYLVCGNPVVVAPMAVARPVVQQPPRVAPGEANGRRAPVLATPSPAYVPTSRDQR